MLATRKKLNLAIQKWLHGCCSSPPPLQKDSKVEPSYRSPRYWTHERSTSRLYNYRTEAAAPLEGAPLEGRL